MVPITIHNSDYRSINRRNFLEKQFLHIGILHGTYVKVQYGGISRFFFFFTFEKQDRFGKCQ